MDAHNTVETPNSGHVAVILVPYREVSTLQRLKCYREVYLGHQSLFIIQRLFLLCPLFRVSLYWRFHCINIQTSLIVKV